MLKFMHEVGVPDSWPQALGAVKVAGAVGLLAGLRAKPLGIAAGSGLVLYFCGTVITHVRAGVFRNISFPGAYLGLSSISLALATRPSYRLTTLIIEIESMCVRGDVNGKGIGYPIGAGSAWSTRVTGIADTPSRRSS